MKTTDQAVGQVEHVLDGDTESVLLTFSGAIGRAIIGGGVVTITLTRRNADRLASDIYCLPEPDQCYYDGHLTTRDDGMCESCYAIRVVGDDEAPERGES